MEMIKSGGRSIAIDPDLPQAAYRVRENLNAQVRRARGSGGSGPSVSVRAVVEVQRFRGGVAWRAVLGGIWTPAAGSSMAIEVCVADPAEQARAGQPQAEEPQPKKPQTADFPSLITPAHRYRAGLIDEFAPHALRGAEEAADEFTAGFLQIDRAGYDDESSGLIFHTAAHVLARVLQASATGADPLAAALAELRSW